MVKIVTRLQPANDNGAGKCLHGWGRGEGSDSIALSPSDFERKSTASCSISAGSRLATWFSMLSGTCPLMISFISSFGSSFISRLNTISLLSFCAPTGDAAGLPPPAAAAALLVWLTLPEAVVAGLADEGLSASFSPSCNEQTSNSQQTVSQYYTMEWVSSMAAVYENCAQV